MRIDESLSSGAREKRKFVFVQLCILVFLTVFFWRLLGPEPETSAGNKLQLILIGGVYALCTGLWISMRSWPRSIKLTVFLCSFLVMAIAELQLARSYDISLELLEPAKIEGDRIVHQGLGLSYHRIPGSNEELKPQILIEPNRMARPSQTPNRVPYGGSAFLGRMILPQKENTNSRFPSTVIIDVEHARGRVANRFIRDIHNRERDMSRIPNVRITQHTHVVRFGGIPMIQFEFADDKQQLISRHVHFQIGRFIVSFTFNTCNADEMSAFEDLLNSIRLKPINTIPFLPA